MNQTIHGLLVQYVRNRISQEPDWYKAADECLSSGAIPSDRVDEALRVTLGNYLREIYRQERHGAIRTITRVVRSGKDNQSARLALTEALGRMVMVGGTLRPLTHCTPADLDIAIEGYWKRAESNAREAERFTRVRVLFDIHPEATNVANLPLEEVADAVADPVPIIAP